MESIHTSYRCLLSWTFTLCHSQAWCSPYQSMTLQTWLVPFEGRRSRCTRSLVCSQCSPRATPSAISLPAPGTRFMPGHDLQRWQIVEHAQQQVADIQERQDQPAPVSGNHNSVLHAASVKGTHCLYQRNMPDWGPSRACARLPRSNSGNAIYKPLSGRAIGARPTRSNSNTF